MVLRKITIDNSVKYIPLAEKEIKQNTIKNKKIQPASGGGMSNMRKQDKKFSKNNKKFVKDFTAGGFAILKWIMNYYF